MTAVLGALTLGVRAMAVGVSAPQLTPGEGNAFDLYAAVAEEHDNNLFRLPSDVGSIRAVASPGASRSDSVTVASLGGDGQYLVGRQEFDLNLHADENRFSHNSFLNNTSGYARLLWDWQVGGHFSGTAGANYSRALVSFGEALYLGRDFIDSDDFFGTGRYQIGPHWALYGAVRDSSIAHTAELAQTSNFRTAAGSVGVEYALGAADSLDFEYRYDNGRFKAGEVFTLDGISFSPDFHDQTALLIYNHSFSDKTQLTADAGYTKRFYPNTSVGTYSGEVGRLTFNWLPTGKTQLAFAAWRELHAYLVSQSNYFVSTGGSLTPTWFATEKLTASAALSYEKQNYIPQSVSVTTLGPVNARSIGERVFINYSPRDSWIIGLNYNHSRRSANALSFNYGDDLAILSVLYKTR